MFVQEDCSMSDKRHKPRLEYDYETEIKERWGDTSVYQEYKDKTKDYSGARWATANLFMMVIFSEFADCMNAGDEPCDKEVQELVAKLQAHITQYYYTCTKEILAGLGEMYVADERFKKNIDKHSKGTAEFVSKAISIYCEVIE